MFQGHSSLVNIGARPGAGTGGDDGGSTGGGCNIYTVKYHPAHDSFEFVATIKYYHTNKTNLDHDSNVELCVHETQIRVYDDHTRARDAHTRTSML